MTLYGLLAWCITSKLNESVHPELGELKGTMTLVNPWRFLHCVTPFCYPFWGRCEGNPRPLKMARTIVLSLAISYLWNTNE